jgi:DNA uptake protein ComE-like DNA-binding protein
MHFYSRGPNLRTGNVVHCLTTSLQTGRDKAENEGVHSRRKLLFWLTSVPFVVWNEPGWSSGSEGAPRSTDALVDINRASLDELLKVPGMTRSWAGRIIRFRPYRMKSDLVERGVVTSEVYGRIKDYIVAHRNPQ